MRLKEWFLWHFPEVNKIISDNILYVKIINLMEVLSSSLFIFNSKKCRAHFTDEMKEQLTELVIDSDIAQNLIDAAKNSMGQDLIDLDKVRNKNLFILIENDQVFE